MFNWKKEYIIKELIFLITKSLIRSYIYYFIFVQKYFINCVNIIVFNIKNLKQINNYFIGNPFTYEKIAFLKLVNSSF